MGNGNHRNKEFNDLLKEAKGLNCKIVKKKNNKYFIISKKLSYLFHCGEAGIKPFRSFLKKIIDEKNSKQ